MVRLIGKSRITDIEVSWNTHGIGDDIIGFCHIRIYRNMMHGDGSTTGTNRTYFDQDFSRAMNMLVAFRQRYGGNAI